MASQFTCPHCCAVTEIAEHCVGETVSCAKCGKTVTVTPIGKASPFSGPSKPANKSTSKGCLVEVLIGGAFIAIVVLAVFGTIVFQINRAAREPTHSRLCGNNIKQISLALLNYEQAYGTFPPAYIPDKNGRPMHSWRVLILPFLEQQSLYKQYRFDEPWDSPNNRKVSDAALHIFQCPSQPDQKDTETSYMMVIGLHTISDGPHGRKVSEITDGTKNTIMLVEVADSGVRWAEPRDLSIDKIRFGSNGDKWQGISSHHPGGAFVSFCDGAISHLNYSTYPQYVKALLTIDGGEPMGRP